MVLSPGQGYASFLVSEETIRQKLSSIFVDSIILDTQFNLVTISQNVLEWLGFVADELKFKNINYLSGEVDLARLLSDELRHGHSNEKIVILYSKTNDAIRVGMAGFYLGLVTDINDRIVLLVKRTENTDTQKQASENKSELDTFIYRTAHDLRGPLATIKGLINLIKIRKSDDELERLVQLIDSHANKLDERLFQLVYLSQYGHEVAKSWSSANPGALETRLRTIIEKNAFVDFLDFHCEVSIDCMHDINEGIFVALCENLLMHVLSLPMKDMENHIFFRVDTYRNTLKLTLVAEGFDVDAATREVLDDFSFLYTDLMKFPGLVHFYAAQKLAGHLRSRISMTMVTAGKQQMEVIIPLTP